MVTEKTDLNPQGISIAGVQSHDWNAPLRVSSEYIGPIDQISGTVGGYEPRPSAKRQASWTGPECPNPDCGSSKTPVRTSGKDIDERPLRERVCANCGTAFTTIEQVVLVQGGAHSGEPVKFALIDVEHRRRKRESKRRRFGWSAGGAMLRTREVRVHGVPRVDGRSMR